MPHPDNGQRVIDQLAGGSSVPTAGPPPSVISIGSRRLRPFAVFDTYWWFAAERQAIFYRRLRAVFELLRGFPSLGGFLAYQFAIDLNYSTLLDHSEMDFVVAGPGARDGISKCFHDTDGLTDADIIAYMTDHAAEHFTRLGLEFQDLWGRPLQLIDAQNLFCEVSKYARVAHPEVEGIAGRTRIKQMFTPLPSLGDYRYPPRWNLPAAVTAHLRQAAHTAVSARAGHP